MGRRAIGRVHGGLELETHRRRHWSTGLCSGIRALRLLDQDHAIWPWCWSRVRVLGKVKLAS